MKRIISKAGIKPLFVISLITLSVIMHGQIARAQSAEFNLVDTKAVTVGANSGLYCNFSSLEKYQGWITATGTTQIGEHKTLSEDYQQCIYRYFDKKENVASIDFSWFSISYSAPSYSKVTFNTTYKLECRHYNKTNVVRIAYFDFGTDPQGYWNSRKNDSIGNSTIYVPNLDASYGASKQTHQREQAAISQCTIINKPSSVEHNPNSITIDNHDGENTKEELRYGGLSVANRNINNKNDLDSAVLSMKYSCDITYYKVVTFNANGGQGSMDLLSAENGTALPKCTMTHPGYIFSGWATSATGEKEYDDMAVLSVTKETKGTMTLYALWEKKSSTGTNGLVSYKNGTSVTPEDINANIAEATEESPMYALDLTNATMTADDAKTIVSNIRNGEFTKNAFVFLPNIDGIDDATKATSNVITTNGTDYTCQNLVLVDNTSMVPALKGKSISATNASYSRTITNAWGTIYLPYPVKSDATIQYYKLKNVSSSTLTFEPVNDIDANTPAIFQRKNGTSSITPTAMDATINVVSDENSASTDVSSWQLIGSYKAVNLGHTDENIYYIASNKFWQLTQSNTDVTNGAFRAYFKVSSGAKQSHFNIAVLDGNEETTIGTIEDNTVHFTNDTPYNILGQRTNKTCKGIIMVNGKKLINK